MSIKKVVFASTIIIILFTLFSIFYFYIFPKLIVFLHIYPSVVGQTYRVHSNIDPGCYPICQGKTKLLECKEEFRGKSCEYKCIGILKNPCE